MGFQINVSSNVSDAYGANVYGFAVQDDSLSISNVEYFFETNKVSWTPLGLHVPANVENNTILVSGTMTNVFANIQAQAGTIPHAFVYYTVYVAAENDLGLVSVQSAGRHNGYSIVSVEDFQLNQVIAFTDSDPDNKLTANISSNITGGNIMHYAVVGFSDPNITEEDVHIYADQRITNDVAIFGTTPIPFASISCQVMKVVGVFDDINLVNSTIYDINDVNAGKVFVILKDIGQTGSELDGIGSNHYGVHTEFIEINPANQNAHARVKKVSTNGANIEVNVSGFSGFSVPTQFVTVAVSHGTPVANITDVTGHLSFNITPPDAQLLRVVEHNFTFTGLDLSKEYDVYTQFVTTDPAKTSAHAFLYSNMEDPELTNTYKIINSIYFPSADITDLSINASDISGNVNLTAHPFIAVSGATKVQVVLSVHGDKTVDQLVASIDTVDYYETANIDIINTFTLGTTLEGYAVSQVSRVYVYALVTTEDESYLDRDLAYPDVVSRNNDDLYITFGETSKVESNLEANINAIFNVGANLAEAFVVLTTHGYLTADPSNLTATNPGVTSITFDPNVASNELVTLVDPTQHFTGAYDAVALTHEITVTVSGTNMYVFTPSVQSFLKGHTYIFDNRLQHGTHPLNFDDISGVSPYQFTPDANGYTTVAIPADSTDTVLFAHCEIHPGMGYDVNSGDTGIPVNDISGSGYINLASGQVYYINVVTSAHGVYHGPLVEPDAAGIRMFNDPMTTGFEASPSGNNVDMLYPYISLVEYHTNKLVVPVGGLTVVDSGGANVSAFYLMAFDSAVSLDVIDYSKFRSITTEHYITPDQISDDIYTNATSLNILFKYTSSTNASSTDGIRPGQKVNVVVVAVSTDTESEAFVNEFVVPSDVTGIHDTFGSMFSADKKSLMFMSGGQARGPGQVRVGIFTEPQVDPITAANETYYSSSTDAPSDGLSYLSTLITSDLTQTTTNPTVSLEYVNRVYVYAWVHHAGSNSAVASAVAKHSTTGAHYTQILDVRFDSTTLSIDTSVFAFAEDITTYYVGVIETNYASENLTTDEDIITTLTASYSPSPVMVYPTTVGHHSADIKTTTLTHAISSDGTVTPLTNKKYNVYLLVSNEETQTITSVSYEINLPGVTNISNLTFDRVNNHLIFNVTANGFENPGSDGTLKAVAYTYANPTPITSVNALVGDAHIVSTDATGAVVTGLKLDRVKARDGTEQDPNFVNEVHVYVWLEAGIVKSLVYSQSILASTTPYPVIHDATGQLETGSVSGSLTVFDDTDGYYIGLFRADVIATSQPPELFYGFFVDNQLPFTTFSVTDGNVGNVDFTLTTAYTDLSNSDVTSVIQSKTLYKVVAIALLSGGSFTMTQSAELVATGGDVPTVANFGIDYNNTYDTADIETIDLVVPDGVTGTFYALATTYPLTTSTAQKLNNAARVTLASGLASSVTFSLANAFPKVMDLDGDIVDFKSVRAAYAYAWGVNTTTGDVGGVTVAINGFDGPSANLIPRLNVVTADPIGRALTVDSASVFSATSDIDTYMIFAMKDINQTSKNVMSFVSAFLESFTDFNGAGATGSVKTTFGEHNDFDPDLLDDNLYNVPAYSVVITKAFKETGSTLFEDLMPANGYRVYMAAKDINGTIVLYEYPHVLNVSGLQAVSLANASALPDWDAFGTLQISPDYISDMNIVITATNPTMEAFGYNTEIPIDLMIDAGFEVWFDFEHISGSSKYYLAPTIMNPVDITALDWLTNNTTSKYGVHFSMNDTQTEIKYNSNIDIGTSYQLVTGNVIQTSSSQAISIDTHYAIVKVLDTIGSVSGALEVEYQVYNNTLRRSEDLICSVKLSAYQYNTTSAPTNAKFILGVMYMSATPSIKVANIRTNRPDTRLARVGAIQSVTTDTSVKNYHTVSFELNNVTASDVENANIYAAVFTRDLKNEKYVGSLGEFKNEVYSVESKLPPILSVPSGTSVASPVGFTVDTAIDTNGDVVDLYTVNTGYLYVWAKTFESVDFSGGRSVIQEGGDVFAP